MRRRRADRPAVDGDDRARPDRPGSPSVATRPSTVTRPAAIRASARRREATPAAARTFCSRSGGIRPGSASGAVAAASAVGVGVGVGSAPSSASRAATSTSSGGRSSRLVSPNRSRNSKPVPYRNGRPARLGATELDDQPAMEQRPDRVVGVDAADALDGGLRDRLAVGDDRERLEGRRRERGSRPRRRSARRARRPREPSRARPGRRRRRAGCRGRASDDLEIAEPRVDGLAVDAGERCDLAAGQRPLRDEQERLERGLGQLDRRRSAVGRGGRSRLERVGAVHPRRSAVRALRRSRERLQRFVERASRSASRRPRPAHRGRRAGHDRPPRLRLLDDDLAPLHQLQHREERDRDDDPVADARRAGPGARSSAHRAAPRG